MRQSKLTVKQEVDSLFQVHMSLRTVPPAAQTFDESEYAVMHRKDFQKRPYYVSLVPSTFLSQILILQTLITNHCQIMRPPKGI